MISNVGELLAIVTILTTCTTMSYLNKLDRKVAHLQQQHDALSSTVRKLSSKMDCCEHNAKINK